jgi:hypothetical protein
MKQLANVLGIKLTGTLDPCPSCQQAKARQNNTRKLTIAPTREPGETICIDITGPFPEDMHRNKYMVVACDDVTTHSWSKPIQTKTEIGPFAETLISDLLSKGINVRRIRCDNAGENKKYLMPLC